MKLQGQIKKVIALYQPPAKNDAGNGDLITTLIVELENLRPQEMQGLHCIQRHEIALEINALQLSLEIPEETKLEIGA